MKVWEKSMLLKLFPSIASVGNSKKISFSQRFYFVVFLTNPQ